MCCQRRLNAGSGPVLACGGGLVARGWVNAGMWSLKRDGGTKMFAGSGRVGGPPPKLVTWYIGHCTQSEEVACCIKGVMEG